MDIGPPRRIIEVEPVTIPVPETLPEPEQIPIPEPGAEPERLPEPAGPGEGPTRRSEPSED